MVKKVIGLSLTVLAVGVSALAQERPDLSGTWVATAEKPSDIAAAPSPAFGPRFSLTHAGDKLTLVRPVRDTFLSATFTLDGREARNRIPGGVCQGDTESVETAAWEGNAIAFTVIGAVPAGGGARTTLNVKRLVRRHSADTLLVLASMRDSAQVAPRQVGTIYKRSAEQLSAAASSTPAVQKASASIARVGWIAGTWIGTTGPVTVEERWTPPAGGSMIATARTLRNSAMAGFEFLCMAERDGSLVYTALPNARTPATDFVLTTITDDSATFENPAHDYPKMIRYSRLADGSLQTTVSGAASQRSETVVLKKSQ